MGSKGIYIPVATESRSVIGKPSSTNKPIPRPPFFQRCIRVISQPLPEGFSSKRLPRRAFLAGWRATVSVGIALSLISLLANTVLLAWGKSQHIDPFTGYPVLFNGPCSKMQSISTWSHLAINAMSTLLLGASNAAIQCLSAPTRADLDKAHSKGQWLDIGIAGTNWRVFKIWRIVLWTSLIATSIPLHIFYNSTIFSVSTSNEYIAFSVTKDFPNGQFFDLDQNQTVAADLQRNASKGLLERLDFSACFEAYQQDSNGTYANVLLVTNATGYVYDPNNRTTMSGSIFGSYTGYTSIPNYGNNIGGSSEDWTCTNDPPTSPPCNGIWPIQYCLDEYCDKLNKTTKLYASVEYCLAQKVQDNSCTIELSIESTLVVIVANTLKALCFFLAVFNKNFKPLITLGDAIASFLDQPDATTARLEAVSANEIEKKVGYEGGKDQRLQVIRESDPSEKKRRPRWFSGAFRSRWRFTLSFCLLVWFLTVFIFLLSYSPVMLNSSSTTQPTLSQLWAHGFGFIDPNSLITRSIGSPMAQNIFYSNLPQLLLSLVYVFYNALLTSMLVSREFTAFGSKRAGLRVTHPSGYQRSTYWLSLPYRFSIPLLAMSVLLHWTLSQFLYPVIIRIIGLTGEIDRSQSINCVGWSSLGLLMLCIEGAVLLLALLIVGSMRYPNGVPIVRSSSLAISAACHPPEDKTDEARQLLKYGVFSTGDGSERVGLTSAPVRPLADRRKTCVELEY